tara:strand:- start:185 stop:388 length:204 start_codon:yes stop_codon:yes gene_type:complete
MQLLTCKEVAGLLNIKVDTVYLWIKNGTLPEPKRISASTIRFARDEIEEWIDNLPSKGVVDVQCTQE